MKPRPHPPAATSPQAGRYTIPGLRWVYYHLPHALSAATKWIRYTDYSDREAEVLAWVEGLGGVCDCTIRDRAYHRLQRVFEGYEDSDG